MARRVGLKLREQGTWKEQLCGDDVRSLAFAHVESDQENLKVKASSRQLGSWAWSPRQEMQTAMSAAHAQEWLPPGNRRRRSKGRRQAWEHRPHQCVRRKETEEWKVEEEELEHQG